MFAARRRIEPVPRALPCLRWMCRRVASSLNAFISSLPATRRSRATCLLPLLVRSRTVAWRLLQADAASVKPGGQPGAVGRRVDHARIGSALQQEVAQRDGAGLDPC